MFCIFPQKSKCIYLALRQYGISGKTVIKIIYWYVYNWKLRFVHLLPKLLAKIGKKIITLSLLMNN